MCDLIYICTTSCFAAPGASSSLEESASQILVRLAQSPVRQVTEADDNEGWIKTKAFHYKLDTSLGKLEASDNVAYLSELHVLKGKDDKMVLKPSEGQIVTVAGHRFQLLVVLKANRKFRVWMRDAATHEVFGAMAREVETVAAVPAPGTLLPLVLQTPLSLLSCFPLSCFRL